MPEIGTSGSMSGDGKRGVAAWPKLPRPSSTLPTRTSRHVTFVGPDPDLATEETPRWLRQPPTHMPLIWTSSSIR
jgi:hypothetical protein